MRPVLLLGALAAPSLRVSTPLCLVVMLAGACASQPRPAPATAEEERTVLDLRARNAAYARQVDELENRLFVLEDQVDNSRRAAEQRAPAPVPTRVLRAGPRDEAGDGVNARGAGGLGTMAADGGCSGVADGALLVDRNVDYVGAAARTAFSLKRPVLRLTGSEPGRVRIAAVSPRASAPAAEPASILPRTRALEPASTFPSSPAGDTPSGTMTRADSLKLYRHALETLRAGNPRAAEEEFRRFLEDRPVRGYADNAQYWIGECLYDQHDLAAAARAFRRVVEQFPNGNKVPDAMLKLGFTLQALGDDAAGRDVLESLARAFPKHEAARRASARLAHPEPEPQSASAAESPSLGTIVPRPVADPAGAGEVRGRR